MFSVSHTLFKITHFPQYSQVLRNYLCSDCPSKLEIALFLTLSLSTPGNTQLFKHHKKEAPGYLYTRILDTERYLFKLLAPFSRDLL